MSLVSVSSAGGISNDVVAALYNESSEAMQKKVNKKFFPKNNIERKNPVADLALLRLIYLATFNGNKSPFSASQVEVLKKSSKWDKCTIWSLAIGTISSIITIVGISYSGFAFSNDDTEAKKVGLTTLVGIVNGLLTAGSYWATGISPHFASNANNDQQDMLLEMQEIYADLGYKLIELYFSDNRQSAIEIAQNVNIQLIETRIAAMIQSPQRASMIVRLLSQTVTYIKSEEEQVPENTVLRNFILGKKVALNVANAFD